MSKAHPDFRMPVATRINARTATIANAFVNHIVPAIKPSNEDIDEALAVLGMSDGICCAYCGDPYQEWDHLNPMVVGGRPSGYVTEIQNLIPSCKACNASKGNKHWDTWIVSGAPASPAKRGIPELDSKIADIRRYAQWRTPTSINFEQVLGAETWQMYWAHMSQVFDAMEAAHVDADSIRDALAEIYAPPSPRVKKPHRPGVKNPAYVVITGSGESGVLSKTQAVRELVAAMAATGVECNAIADVLGHGSLKSVGGLLGGAALWSALTSTHAMKNPDATKWFVDRPIHQDGKTWVLAKNKWGPDTEKRMSDLVSFAPHPVTFRRADEDMPQSPTKERTA